VKKKRSEVYDLASDPGEEDNLADEPWAKDRIKIPALFLQDPRVQRAGLQDAHALGLTRAST
jgi:hypothetical protein